MTLIIGCVTDRFAIVGGDTQVTSGSSLSNQIKLNSQSNNLIYGILGKWSTYRTDGSGVYLRYDEQDRLNSRLNKNVGKPMLEVIQDFLKSNKGIDGTLIYTKKSKHGFISISSLSSDNPNNIKPLRLGSKRLLFNEVFYKTKNDFIAEIITNLNNDNSLSDSLVDSLFLVNNCILHIISLGEKISVSSKGANLLDIQNTVGGYVTISLLLKDPTNRIVNLAQPYLLDPTCLLDRTTNPYSLLIYKYPSVRYYDNLCMIAKNIDINFFDKYLCNTLIELLIKQINYLHKEKKLSFFQLNLFISKFNKKYSSVYKLTPFKKTKSPHEVTIDIDTIFPDEDEKYISEEYLKRFL